MSDPDSPYAPPRADVDDVEPALPPLERPPRMTPVLICVGIDYAIGVLSSLLALVRAPLAGTPQMVALVLVFALIGAGGWINFNLALGRNWARLTYVGFAAFAILSATLKLLRYAQGDLPGPVLMPLLAIVGLGLELFVVWTLFTAPVRDWYHAMRGHK